MEIFKTVLTICCFSLVFNVSSSFPQSREKSKNRSPSALDKKVSPGDDFSEKEIESPFRYVIIDDDVQFGVEEEEQEDVPVRRFVKVLIEERAFNEANLRYLFKYLSNYYADPAYLGIDVHTSLMTLETLEEGIAMSTHSSRDNFQQFYKTAHYSRFWDRSEIFGYDTGKPGKFIRKFVDLPKTKKK